jgi:hypothetical protein
VQGKLSLTSARFFPVASTLEMKKEVAKENSTVCKTQTAPTEGMALFKR